MNTTHKFNLLIDSKFDAKTHLSQPYHESKNHSNQPFKNTLIPFLRQRHRFSGMRRVPDCWNSFGNSAGCSVTVWAYFFYSLLCFFAQILLLHQTQKNKTIQLIFIQTCMVWKLQCCWWAFLKIWLAKYSKIGPKSDLILPKIWPNSDHTLFCAFKMGRQYQIFGPKYDHYRHVVRILTKVKIFGPINSTAIRHLVSSVVEENAHPNYFLKMDNYGMAIRHL